MFSKDSLRGGKKASSFNTTNLISHLKGRHRGEAVLKGASTAGTAMVFQRHIARSRLQLLLRGVLL